MSLESQIEILTAAIIANTDALRAANGIIVSDAPSEGGIDVSKLGVGEPAKRGRKSRTTEPTQPAATSATPAATAPAAGLQTQSPAVSPVTVAEIERILALSAKTGAELNELKRNLQSPAGLLVAATEAIIVLAGAYSRDTAVGILALRKVTRCSDLPADQHRPVLNEALTEIAKAEALKTQAAANASLV